MIKVKYLTVEDDVNLFVVGDIHGEYSKLINELNIIGFDYNKDLLIGVGDLVDRGKENEKCVGLLNESWFTTVRGNHEQFCIDALLDSTSAFYHKMDNNGGAWFYQQPEDIQECIAKMFSELPIMLEVKYNGKKYGFVHANLPYQDWEHVKSCLEHSDNLDGGRSVESNCLWSRDIINSMSHIEIGQVDEVFFGHTPLHNPVKLGNCNFIDTGAVFGGKLTIVKLGD